MKHVMLIGSVVIAISAAPALAQTTAAPKEQHQGAHKDMAKAGAKMSDEHFVKDVAIGGMAEVQLGKLATEKAASADVKKFGQRMVDDHGKANDELKGLASKKNVTLPTEMDAKHMAMQNKLAKMKGAEFDRAYIAHMVSSHAQAVALFQKESKSGTDADVKAWAAKTLPTVQEHQKMAQSINAKLKGSAKPAGKSPGGY